MFGLRSGLVLIAGIASVATVAAAPATAPLCVEHHPFKPAFADDFVRFSRYNGSAGTWDTSYPWGRTNPGAHDDAYYVDPSLGMNPFDVTPEGLTITAASAPPSVRGSIANHPYTSGIITTRHSFSQTYGYFEARMRMPQGKGLWPAFWLLPVAGFPPELDVVEVLGDAPQRVYASTHAPNGSGSQVHADIGDPRAFHTYGMAWTPDGITFSVDGARIGTAPNVSTQPMYLLLNLQVGGAGSWPGQPDSPREFPATMTIRYVHAYSLQPGTC